MAQDTKRTELLRFGAQLAREVPTLAPHHVALCADELMKLAARATAVAVDQCNRPEKVEGEYDRKTERIRAKVDEVCKTLGITASVNAGDPRGAAIKLILPSGKTNDWGADGFCVPYFGRL